MLAIDTGDTKRATTTMSGNRLYGTEHDNRDSYMNRRYKMGHPNSIRTQTVWHGHDNTVTYRYRRYKKGHTNNVRTQTVWHGT